MGQFEAEVKNSIGQLQATVAKLTAEVERSNAGMRNLSQSTRQVAGDMQHLGNHGSNAMKSIAYGSKEAGSHIGGILSHVSHLNPAFLLAGLGVGFVTEKVMELVSSFGEAAKKAEELAEQTRKAKEAAHDLDLKTALGANVASRRAAASSRFRTNAEDRIDPDVWLAMRIGEEHGLSAKDARAAAEAEKRKSDYLASGAGIFPKAPAATPNDLQRAASGFGDDRAGFEQAELARKYGSEFIQARILEEMQRMNAYTKERNEQESLNRISGVQSTGQILDDIDARRADLEAMQAEKTGSSR